MKYYLTMLVRYTLIILVTGPLVFLSFPGVAEAATTTTIFADEFIGTSLNSKKWVVVHGNPRVANGKLTLTGGVSRRAEIQSRRKFGYSVMKMVITSSYWKPQNETTDSSFGYEIWKGANGNCHYGVVLVANGNLGLLRSEPDASGNCYGDPKFQAYVPISNWDVIRAGKTIRVTLIWDPTSVTLNVSSGTNSGTAYYLGTAEPIDQLKICLNVDTSEKYKINFVRILNLP